MRPKAHGKTRKLVAVAFAVPLAIGGVVGIGSGVAVAADPEPVHAGIPCQDLVMPIDEDATPETVNLFQNMYYNADQMFLYGRQDDQSAVGGTAQVYNRGTSTWSSATGNSWGGTKNKNYGMSYTYRNIQRYPPIIGYDLGHLELKNDNADWGVLTAAQRSPAYANGSVNAGSGGTSTKFTYGTNVNGTRFDDIAYFVKEHASWNGIGMIALHQVNPITYGVYNYNLYMPGRWAGHPGTAASMVIPGGELNARYQSWLDSYIDWNNDLTAANGGTPIPIMFRPYHEHSGDWFWWGIDDMERGWRPAEIAEFEQLWKFTVDYMTGNGVHNFLWVISPDRSRLGEPSYMYGDLASNPALEGLIDLYINNRWPSGTTRTQVNGEWAAVKALVASAGFDSTNEKWNDQIALNYQGVPLDLNPTTGARQNNVRTEFDTWFVVDPNTGTTKFEDYFWNKWSEGLPGPEYVDVYGMDNYWENTTTGHQYHPYNGAGAKLQELFWSSLNTIAKHAREDGKLVGLTEGGFSSPNLISWLVDYSGTTYEYLKYTSFYVAWVGTQFADSGLSQSRANDKMRWVVDSSIETVPNMLPNWYATKVGCFLQEGDIDVDVEVPQYLGGLGIEFGSSTMSLGTIGLSTDKAFWEGTGTLPTISIEDLRAAEPSLGWDATITAGDWVTGPVNIDGKAFGITPTVVSAAYGQTVTAGAPVDAWFVGFKAPGTNLASAAVGASRGIAKLGGDISFRAPSNVPTGAYSGVFSVTVL